MRIVYEDDAFLVAEKPAGMPIALRPGDRKGKRPTTLIDRLKIGQRRATRAGTGPKQTPRLRAINPLDPAVCGLVVIAKTDEAAAALTEQFHSARSHRIATAVVRGSPSQDMLTIKSMLVTGRDGSVRSFDEQEMPIGREGREAVAHVRVQERAGELTLIRIRLDTDRPGQAIAQLRQIGLPLVGDPGPRARPLDGPIRMMLHLGEIAFRHPVTHEQVKFTTPPPPAFRLRLEDAAATPHRPQPQQKLESRPEPRSELREEIQPGTSSALRPLPPSPAQSPPEPPTSQEEASFEVPPTMRRPVKPRPIDPVEPLPASPALKPAPEAVSPVSETPAVPPPPVQQSEPPKRAPEPVRPAERDEKGSGSWEHVAGWYDDLLERRGSDHHTTVVLPGVLRLLDPQNDQRILDVACGQGLLARELTQAGASVIGVDASPSLIEAARKRVPRGAEFFVADARELGRLKTMQELDLCDSAACVLAAMNFDPIEPAFGAIASMLRPGGRFVLVILHPAFRIPGQTAWVWRTEPDGSTVQSRQVDAYLSPASHPITMNPGEVARGKRAVTTWTHHRPLSAYTNALGEAGLLVDRIEEWASERRSEPGPRAEAENRARAEIPMFAAIRAVRVEG